MGIQFYHAVVYFQPLRVCENRRPDARLMYASGIFYNIFERAELRNKLRSGFRSYLVGAADIVGAVARHRLEIGISARLYAVFIAHRLLRENHRSASAISEYGYILRYQLEKVAVKGGNDDIVFPGKPDGIRGYYVVGLKLLDLGVPQSEVVKRRVYVGKL